MYIIICKIKYKTKWRKIPNNYYKRTHTYISYIICIHLCFCSSCHKKKTSQCYFNSANSQHKATKVDQTDGQSVSQSVRLVVVVCGAASTVAAIISSGITVTETLVYLYDMMRLYVCIFILTLMH